MVQLADGPAEAISLDVLDPMTEVIRHRGPSDVGTYVAPAIAIGVRRLSDRRRRGGHQPLRERRRQRLGRRRTASSTTTTRLGDELRSDGHSFARRCDTEVIPHLYEDYGDAFPQKLRGMFGIAVWDEARRRAVLARDRLGSSRSTMRRPDDRARVRLRAQERARAAGLVDLELDYAAIDAYLTLGFFPAPPRLCAAGESCFPGTRLVVEDGNVSERAVLDVSSAQHRTRGRRSTSRRRGSSRSSMSLCGCG